MLGERDITTKPQLMHHSPDGLNPVLVVRDRVDILALLEAVVTQVEQETQETLDLKETQEIQEMLELPETQ